MKLNKSYLLIRKIINPAINRLTYKLIILLLTYLLIVLSCTSEKKKVNMFENAIHNNSIICEIPKLKVPLRLNFTIIYYDNNYLFGSRGYGRSEHSWGNTVPGLFVHSKKFNTWLKISQISTKNGKFGLAWDNLNEEDKTKLSIYSVDMNQEGLKNRKYCNLPLNASDVIVFPQIIKYNTKNKEYILEFFNSTNVEAIKTILKFKKADLDLEFESKLKK